MHVFGLWTDQVIDLADVRLGIGEQCGEHTRHVFRGDRRSLTLTKRQSDLIEFRDRFRSENQEEALEKHCRPHVHAPADQTSSAPARRASATCVAGLSVVSVMLICEGVICDILMNAFTP